MIRKGVVNKSNPTAVSVLFAVFDYFMYLKNNIEKFKNGSADSLSDYKGGKCAKLLYDNKDILIPKIARLLNRNVFRTKGTFSTELLNGNKVENNVNNVIAISLYIILSIDYANILNDFISNKMQPENIDNLIKTLLQLSKNVEPKEVNNKLKKIILEYIFNGNKERIFPPIAYFSLLAIVLGINFDINQWKRQRQQFFSETQKKNVIKDKLLLVSLLRNFHLLDAEAKVEFLCDLKELAKLKSFHKELIEGTDTLLIPLFELIKYPEAKTHLVDLLGMLMANLLIDVTYFNVFIKVACTMKGDGLFILSIISHTLNNISSNANKVNKKALSGFLYLLYIIEDTMSFDPKVLSSTKLIEIMARMLCVLSEYNLLYIPLPVMSQFNEELFTSYRKLEATKERKCTEGKVLREGGFVRVIIKLLVLLIKFDKSSNMPSITLFLYYLNNNNELKLQVEQIANIKSKGSVKDTESYNLFDVILKDKKKWKQHVTLCEAFESKSIIGCHGLLYNNKPLKCFDIFENLLLYLLSALFQLMHYEFLGIERYEDVPKVAVFEGIKLTQRLENIIKPLILILKNKLLYKKLQDILTNAIPKQEHTLIGYMIPEGGVSIDEVYSVLNKFYETTSGQITQNNKQLVLEGRVNEELANKVKLRFHSFKKNFHKLLQNIFNIIEENGDVTNQLISIIVNIDFIKEIQPFLLFVTAHPLFLIDNTIFNIGERSIVVKKLVKELSRSVRKQFSLIMLNTKQSKHEDLIEYYKYLGDIKIKSVGKELSRETGGFFNKEEYKKEKEEFEYISKKYKTLIKMCPLHRHLEESKKIAGEDLDSFVQLSLRRDSLGRAQRMKRINLKKLLNTLKTQNLTIINFKYLRQAYLRRIILVHLLSSERKTQVLETGYLRSDFKHDITKFMFTFPLEKRKQSHDSGHSSKTSVISQQPPKLKQSIQPYFIELNEDLATDESAFEAEIIEIAGGSFGILTLSSMCLVFKSTSRKSSARYLLGSTEHNTIDKNMKRMWTYNSVKEVIVKRYNLIRQAVEMYFSDESKPVFVSFFSSEQCKLFMKCLSLKLKELELDPLIVMNCEQFFGTKNFTEQWLRSELSNFDYLMLLNKYGGRSLNDLSQYFVFPWVLVDFECKKPLFRNLKLPISGISKMKREIAGRKLDKDLNDEYLTSDNFQFGSHYLSSRAVLGYLLRIEPFASLLLKFEGEAEASSRMFHDLKQQWKLSNLDIMDNKELIPEFFYLPEIFINYNKYFFGAKELERRVFNLPEKLIVRVDQVVLPEWADNIHHFIKIQRLALESQSVSLVLNDWIDLVFGANQQSQSHYNRFRDFCDEVTVLKMNKSKKLVKDNIRTIQEFGTNPIKLFRVKHTSRSKAEIDKQISDGDLFYGNNDHLHTLTKLNNFKSPITFIEYYKENLILIMDNKKLSYVKLKGNKATINNSIEIHTENIEQLCIKDQQRTIAFMQDKSITCQYLDNSCRIFDYINKSTTKETLYFNDSPILSIIATSNKLFAGSADGIVYIWSALKGIEAKAYDHDTSVVSLDYNEELDLLVSGSTDKTIAVRSVTPWKFLRFIKLNTLKDYTMSHVRLSARGYVLSVFLNDYKESVLYVHSINGEVISSRKIKEMVNCVVFDKMGYHFIAGGTNAMLLKFDLLTLKSNELLFDGSIHELNKNVEVTSLVLTVKEKSPILFIGTNLGYCFSCQRKKVPIHN